MGLMGQREGQTSPLGGWCAPPLVCPALGKEKGRASPSCLSLSWEKGKGGAPPSPTFLRTPNKERRGRGLGGTPSRIPPTWAPPLAAPPSLPPIYMWEGGA